MKPKQHHFTWLKRWQPLYSHAVRPWDKVKTVWIAVLIVMNVLLLAVWGVVHGYDAWLSAQTRTRLDSMLAQKGILCGSSVYHILETCPQAYSLRMDDEVQEAFTHTLLTGEVDTEAKGSVTAWHGDNGTVEWSASGTVHAQVRLPKVIQPQNADQAENAVYGLLKQAGISIHRDQMEVEQNETGYIVTVWQEIDGAELAGCRLQFTIAAENQFTIEGAWCTGSAEPMTIRALKSYSAEETLLTFMREQESVTQIVQAKPAYILSDRSGGRFTAIPCWRFATDTEEYVLNILTGEVITAEGLDTYNESDEPQPDDSFQEDLDSWDDDGSEPADSSWDENADIDPAVDPDMQPDAADTE